MPVNPSAYSASQLALAAAGLLLLVAAAIVLAGVLLRPRPTPEPAAYDEHDQLHVDLTGVPASNADLGRDPRTGDLHLRDRLPARPSAESPGADAAANPETPAAAPVPRRAPAAPADEDAAADPAATGPTIPDLPPGTNTVATLPDGAGAGPDPVTVVAEAYAAGDPEAVAAVAGPHPELAWSANLLAATLTPNPAYARHLDAAYAAAQQDPDPTTTEPAALASLRAAARIPVPVPGCHAVADVPADPDGLTIAHLAHELTYDPAGVDGQADLTHLLHGTSLTLLLAAEAALATRPDADLPPLPGRRADQWGLLYAFTRLRHLHAARPADLEPAAARTRTLLGTATPADDLYIDTAALADDITYLQASAAARCDDPARALALLAQIPDHRAAAALRGELRTDR